LNKQELLLYRTNPSATYKIAWKAQSTNKSY